VTISRFGQAFGHLHSWLYEASGGGIGARGAGRDMLLLTTTGRRSGQPRTLPLAYLRDGDAFDAVDADAAERVRLWPLLTEYNPPYARYAERTARKIPVVVLRRR
jgi:hypothetical protein